MAAGSFGAGDTVSAHVELEDNGPDGYMLHVTTTTGKHSFHVDPSDLDDALHGYRMHMLEGEVVRREREAAGGVSWQAYRDGFACVSPEDEWIEMLREQGDLSRKRDRENAA